MPLDVSHITSSQSVALLHPVITPPDILLPSRARSDVTSADTNIVLARHSHLIAHVDSTNAHLTSKNVILMMAEGAGL